MSTTFIPTTNHNVTPMPTGTLVEVHTTNGGRIFGALAEPTRRIGRPCGCGWVRLVIANLVGGVQPMIIDAGRISSLDMAR